MEELTNSDTSRVVLNIKEGKGFEKILLPTLVVATLNGHSLETEIIESSPNPQYDHDLVWEVDKSRLRKMRSGQVPLKLECFAVKGNDSKEKLGYLLLSLRSAQVFNKHGINTVRANWLKVLGLKSELKVDKPELLLALSIHDQEATTVNSQLELKNLEEYQQTNSQFNKVTPVLLRDERLIQLGPLDICHELFLMSITAVSATNVDSLLTTELYCMDIKNNLYFWCKILENDVYFNQSKKESGQLWILNEKIVIRIRSSLKIFKEYLSIELNLQPLISTDNIEEFLKMTENNSSTLNQRCYLYKKNSLENDQVECTHSYLDLQLKLQYVGGKIDETMNTPNIMINNLVTTNSTKELKDNLKQTNCSEIDYHRNPAGDFGKYIGGAQIFCYPNGCNNIKHTLSCGAIKDQPVKTVCSHSVDTLLCQSSINDNVECVETYHCYCLNISLISIKSISTKLTVPCLEIRFHHPKTENISIFYPKIQLPLGEKIKLHDIGCKLQFISAMDEIKQLLLTFPPKISIYKVEGNAKTCISKSIINTKEFFLQNKAEYQYNIPLYDMEQNNIGSLDIVLSLDDHGPYYRIKRTTLSENLGPPILDDSLAYKIVDELETWKERQIEIFKIELKRKEDRHLNLLSQEWQKQRESLETKLACSVEQCKMLANSLNNATEDLRTRRLKSLEKETRLIKANEDLQWRYETKLRDLKQTLQTMQEELMSKISALEKRKISLEAQVEQLSTENERLQLLVTKQSEEIETYQKGSLTQDQTANLLQELKTLEEKLQNAQENKSFFKEQWRNAVREIHRMKMEHQQAVQVQIKNSKEELQNLDLEEILCADSTALTNDQILLSEIQKEIDVIKPKTSFLEKSAYCQAFTPSSIGPTISQHTNKSAFKRSEAHNERLQALLEERDSLLKTGSYMMDDMVIMKLNNEIRSLMMK
ncbi:PREDICTED: LOW QUALITY PROTEIN: centrosomal protein of 120 kDa-like [Habropoda laboriosa]|uniref:LOW QUALITY PROTEIN: centrosomal protein of 120 kDa-like n=1 Tax=Habropoda laboriosa TaxID=597456 RepID=UPI00083E4CBB|nr:PREDICTED: LOW QUALITY PROTEIN: centrosomal protein of 120 kDa-like [Habropoda laboriosa]